MIKVRVLCESQSKYELSIDKTVDTRDGLVDATDVPRSPICYSCRNVACGSCLIEVSDVSLLEPPDEDELDVLRSMGADAPNQRIACACRFRSHASGTIRVRKGY